MGGSQGQELGLEVQSRGSVAMSFLYPLQGDVVNYDEIKRFIQQEISKMFDGNGVIGARAGAPPAPV